MTRLFFSVNDDYERELKEEIYLCHKHMNLSISEIYDMPVSDRRAYIRIHNHISKKEKEEYDNIKNN